MKRFFNLCLETVLEQISVQSGTYMYICTNIQSTAELKVVLFLSSTGRVLYEEILPLLQLFTIQNNCSGNIFHVFTHVCCAVLALYFHNFYIFRCLESLLYILKRILNLPLNVALMPGIVESRMT